MQTRREGMLKPEFTDWYPSLQPGRWYAASELTDLVLDHLRHGSPQWRPEGRIPSDDHFVFRGDSVDQKRAGRVARRSEAHSSSADLDS